MAREEGVPTPAGDAPRSDVTRFSIEEVNRLRGVLTSAPHNLNIADPRRSNHCVGPGCEGSSGTKIAFDTSGAPITQIAAGFMAFKTDLGPNGYLALLRSGVLQEEFVTTGFVAPNGWKMEPANGAVHVEVTPVAGSEISRGSLLPAPTATTASTEAEATTAAAADTAAAAENPAPTVEENLPYSQHLDWFANGWSYSDSAGNSFSTRDELSAHIRTDETAWYARSVTETWTKGDAGWTAAVTNGSPGTYTEIEE